ncbi:MAG: hypothetical protein CMQ38_01395 [Gammaproteobacteria bacterium]|nr:hypothetical protein [Gammaproteobacteria bacterium]|tara:strand:+ start:319 stop:561 length:243 start_codon:yes stop_codon:yes gene_type:complete
MAGKLINKFHLPVGPISQQKALCIWIYLFSQILQKVCIKAAFLKDDAVQSLSLFAIFRRQINDFTGFIEAGFNPVKRKPG